MVFIQMKLNFHKINSLFHQLIGSSLIIPRNAEPKFDFSNFINVMRITLTIGIHLHH
jgi:hypothetical protein